MASDDQQPLANVGFFDSFDAVADLVRQNGAGGPVGVSRTDVTAGNATTPHREPEHPGPPHPHTHAYRPTIRRPMALLHVVDDGRAGGEVVRLRNDRTVIGRLGADVVIPHDPLMSPQHACIERMPEGGWRLADLGSVTGTYARVNWVRLRHNSMIQVGATRMRFQEIDLTEAWLVEVSPTGAGRRHECRAPITTIGRSGCTVALDDPFVSGNHAVLRRTKRGWKVSNDCGTNGLWWRLEEPKDLQVAMQFICGEQRFVFEPLA